MILYQISFAILAKLETSEMNWDFRRISDQSDLNYQRMNTAGYKVIFASLIYEAIIDGLRLFKSQMVVVGILVHPLDKGLVIDLM